MNALNTQSKLARVDLILSSTGSLCNSSIFVTTFVFGAYEIILGYLSIGGLLAFKAIAFLLNNYILKIISSFNNLQAAYADLLRLHDIQLYPEDVRYSLCSDSTYVDENVVTQTKNNKNRKIALNKIRINSKQEDCSLVDSNQSLLMECRNISFGYSKLSAPIVHKFNLKVKEAELIAIAGETGGGKSTIAKLLAGLNHPTEGFILFERREMQSISQSELYDAVSYVDQDITLFSGSIFENLTMWDKTVSNDMVFQAISDACLEELISEKGLAFQLQENGLNLSGGERQRLEIARALINQPKLLILDEATSALDYETEQKVMQNIRKRRCAIISIAHRLSAILTFDQIIVLSDGVILEQGNHEELMLLKGEYYNLVQEENAYSS